ncbi:MAG: hypothetical protein COB67_10580 [SAR324 cluster bacterium]|uniref:Lipoprotein n=1 Tax=SAR324 cluster bacterium TaxID=2024889 RepID=A0A2A4SYN9_9DELT|nr:MAG: hypothetical protein COB67_10580 [SAR324 cluster bacterium]
MLKLAIFGSLLFLLSGCFGGPRHRGYDQGHGYERGYGYRSYEQCVIQKMRGQPSDSIRPMVEKECKRLIQEAGVE